MKIKAQELDPRRHSKVNLPSLGEVDLRQVVISRQSEVVIDFDGEVERENCLVTVTLRTYPVLQPDGCDWTRHYQFDDLVEVVDAAG